MSASDNMLATKRCYYLLGTKKVYISLMPIVRAGIELPGYVTKPDGSLRYVYLEDIV